MTSVKIDNVSKIIRRKKVLDSVSLEINSGKVIGFKGINGSGKTMLMRIVSGLIRPTEGKVFINEKQLHKDISFPESIGVFIENPAFLDAYSGFENLKILASIKKTAGEDRITEVLEQVGLGDAGKKKYRKYSLGMKQRLGIAAAVLEQPDIVILDEPTNSLDDSGVEMVKQIVLEQRDRGALVIISCHDAEILEELSDEIYTITEGRITDHIILGEKNDEDKDKI
ncbi:MAG: ATP-binding cassette domain-containing protein [Clostridiales bacterium]|nr:ATP-binding cassette domain-containing protein [Clostridiales bacterium]